MQDNSTDALEAGRVAWWLIDLPSGEISFNPIKATQLGYNPEGFKHYEDFTSLIHPDDYEPTMQSMRDHLEGKVSLYQCQYRIKDANNKWHTYFDQGVIREKRGKNIRLFGATIDMSKLDD